MMIDLPKGIEIKEHLPLCRYSSFKIGGEADIAVFPKSQEEFLCTIRALKGVGIRFDIIGNGSNILFDDAGYRGALVFTSKMNGVTYKEYDGYTEVCAECGKKLTELSIETLKKHGLRGLEFAYGIPGSVGGAVYMNAGAYGAEMCSVVIQSVCYDTNSDKIIHIDADGHKFSYRHSVFKDNKSLIILSSTLKLIDDTNGEALKKAIANMQSRREKQPLEYPNAGSTFKRPEGLIAAKMIDECGLKGTRIGGAEVSQKHAGFFINTGNATSKDILDLAKTVSDKVYEKFGVRLELEIIYVPEK